MLCLRCNDLYPDSQSRCPRCRSTLVQPKYQQLTRYLDSKFPLFLRSRIEEWEQDKLIDTETAIRLLDTVPAQAPEPPKPKPWTEARVEPKPISPPPPAAVEMHPVDVSAVRAGSHLFNAGSAGLTAAAGGIAALAALDELESAQPTKQPSRWSTEVWPVLYENIGWFIGALFVLAGSVYGVREAWIALGDAARHAVVAGALFAYHGGFTGIAALLSKRSSTAGRFLGAIAAGLLPMSFAALGGLWGETVGGGLMLTVLIAGLSVFTLGSIGRRFEFGTLELASVLLPSLVAQLPLAAGSSLGATLPFVGVGCLAWSLRTPEGNRREALALFAAYGALALQITALVGSPNLGADGGAALLLRLMLVGAAGAIAFGREAWRTKWPHLAPSLEIASLGLAATVAGAATLSSAPTAAGIHALTTALTAVLFALASKRHPRALHVTALSGAAAAASIGLMLGGERVWSAVGVAVAASAGLQATRLENRRLRALAVRWSIFFALAGMVGVPLAGAMNLTSRTAGIAASVVITLAAITAGGLKHRRLHYLAALSALVGGAWWVSPTWNDPFRFFLIATVVYSLAGIALDVLSKEPHRANAYEDAALFSLLLLIPIGRSQPQWANTALVITGVGFLYRAWRDQTRMWSALGASLLAWRVCLALPQTAQSMAFVGIGCLLIASLRGTQEVPENKGGRKLFGSLALPAPAPLRVLWADGFAAAAFFTAVVVLFQCVTWLSILDEDFRSDAVLGMATVAGGVLLAFLTPAFHSVKARGHVATLSLVAVAIAFTGILNRIGRPLPPVVIAQRLTLISIGVWIVAQALRRWGPGLGRRLGNEESGRLYHFVPHTGVTVLASVLAVDAVLNSTQGLAAALQVTPPLFWWGSGLAVALLARSSRKASVLNLSFLLALIATPLIGSQHLLIGDWSPWISKFKTDGWQDLSLILPDALYGPSIFGFFLGGSSFLLARGGESLRERAAWLLLDDRTQGEELQKVLSRWSVIAADVILLWAWFQPTVPSAALCIGAGLLAAGGRRRSGLATAVLSSGVLLHAWAQTQPFIPMWIGPAMAGLGLLLIVGSPELSKRLSRRQEEAQIGAHLLAFALFAMALIYSLATGGVTNATGAGNAVATAAAIKITTQWLASEALVATLLIIGVSTLFMGAQYRQREWKHLLAPTRASTVLLLAMAIVFGLPEAVMVAAHVMPSDLPRLDLLTVCVGFGWQMAPALTLLIIGAQYANRQNTLSGEDESARGLRFGRDAVIVAVALLIIISVAYPATAGSPREGIAVALAFLSLVGLALVSAHAAWRERTSLHVYAVQLTAVGIYGLVRTQFFRNLPPEADACFALALGFVLLGVTVLSRRAGIPPVAVATRRFAALLPFAIAFIMPFQASTSAALMAAGAGALWSALGWMENSRLFGSLGAAAVNLALLAAALTAGMNGVEIYIAPVGLMILALGQIFSDSLTPTSRQIVRILGSLLVYLPAAVQLALQVGAAQNGTYAMGFGLACLAGIALGMLLHIRAYLALGTGFLVLDVVANLVHASLRDHRVGFVVLSLAGLSILGVMIFITLQREYVQRLATAWRARMAGWE